MDTAVGLSAAGAAWAAGAAVWAGAAKGAAGGPAGGVTGPGEVEGDAVADRDGEERHSG